MLDIPGRGRERTVSSPPEKSIAVNVFETTTDGERSTRALRLSLERPCPYDARALGIVLGATVRLDSEAGEPLAPFLAEGVWREDQRQTFRSSAVAYRHSVASHHGRPRLSG